MRSLLLFFIISSTSLFVACVNQPATNQNTNTANAKSPTPSPTVSDEQKKVEEEKSKVELKKAIDEFITKNYKGWKIKAISDEYSCYEGSDSSCDLLLTKGEQEKVIPVTIRRFENDKGETFLVVFEARAIDLAQLKIKEIRENERKATLENLTVDDISDDLKTEIYIDQLDNLQSIRDDIEPYDSR